MWTNQLFLCSLLHETAFVHDEGFDLLRPRTHTELWMAAVFDSYTDCSSQIAVTHIEISSDEIAFDSQLTCMRLFHYIWFDFSPSFLPSAVADGPEFEGFVLATTLCWTGDVIESIASSSMAPTLRLNFSPCPQSPVPGLQMERLQLYRMNASQFPLHLKLLLLCTIGCSLSGYLQRFLWQFCSEHVVRKVVLFIDG